MGVCVVRLQQRGDFQWLLWVFLTERRRGFLEGSRMRDVIFISLENWDNIWRRNQFLCAEWLRRFPEMRLLFVGRPKDFSNAVRTGSVAGLRRPLLERHPDFGGLTILNPIKLLPNSVSACRAANLHLLCLQIRVAARKAGLRAPLLWINDHCAEPLVGRLRERAVVYDITDDWTLLTATQEEERERIRHADRRLCEKADLVVVCSKALERSRQNHCRKMVVVPNGVDAAHYRSCLEPNSVALNCVAADQGAHPATVFGYLGTLHTDRIDLDLVAALAQAKPEARVVLCGPDLLTVPERKRILAAPNVELREPVAYRQVPEVITGFDVCILPHRCTSFTESLNPIKLWEYLASGKPVAATPVAGFRERAHLCHLGSGAEGFVQACEDALKEDPARASARVKEAEANSWKARSEQLLEVFRQQGWLGRPIPRPRRPKANVSKERGSAEVSELEAEGNKGGRIWEERTGLCETPF
jgi:glycosyltransferase involved in cell wall biosynthesis